MWRHRLRPDHLPGLRERVERHDRAGGRRRIRRKAAEIRAATGPSGRVRAACRPPASPAAARTSRRRLEVEQRQRRRVGLKLRRELEQHLYSFTGA